MLKKKETARRKAKKSGRLCHLEKYRDLRRSSKALIKRKRNEFFPARIDEIEHEEILVSIQIRFKHL